MTVQAAPLLTQSDFLDPDTYKELGFFGAAFAITMLVIVFCVFKGHIKFIACGPNEGGIREVFGITLWKCGSGPHLHISGIFAFRKVSFAFKEIETQDEVNRHGSVFDYSIGVKVRVRNSKESIKLRVYAAEDLNRGDGENDEATRQLTSQLTAIVREVLEADTRPEDIERAVKDYWGKIELDELHGTATDQGRSTYGYEILCVWNRKLVERPQSEMARAIKGSELDHPAPAIAAVGGLGA